MFKDIWRDKKNARPEELMMAAIATGRLNAARELLAQGVLVTVGLAAMSLALCAERGFLEMVKFLVDEAHVDVDASNEMNGGGTCFTQACHMGKLEIAEFALSRGANPKHALGRLDKPRQFGQGLEGSTALHMASQEGHLHIVKFLLHPELCVNVNAEISDARGVGETPAHYTASRGHLDVLKELYRAGATLNERRTGREQANALILAALNGHCQVIRYLVETGFDVDKARPDGFTPLMAAAQTGKRAAVELLLELGADPKRQSGAHYAFTIAMGAGHRELAMMLADRAV